jgi:hypothetical protein
MRGCLDGANNRPFCACRQTGRWQRGRDRVALRVADENATHAAVISPEVAAAELA